MISLQSHQMQYGRNRSKCCWGYSYSPAFCRLHVSGPSNATAAEVAQPCLHAEFFRSVRVLCMYWCFLFFFLTCIALTETKGCCEPPCVAVMRTVMIKPNSALTVSTSVDSKSSVRLLAMTKSSNYSLPVLCFLHSFPIHHCIDFYSCVL